MPAFPSITALVDRDKYKKIRPDYTIRTPLENGLVKTRAKFSKVRPVLQIGYTLMSNADKLLIEAFADLVKDGSDIFTWTDPTTGSSLNVRFAENGNPEFTYAGYNTNHIWDCTFTLEVV